MKEWKKLNYEEREKIEELFKEHCGYLDIEMFSEEPYIQFPDGTTVYLEGVAD